MKRAYPASNILDNLDSAQRSLKIARHSPCTSCDSCKGLHPPLGIDVVLDDSSFDSIFGLDQYGSDDDEGTPPYLEFCDCGHDVIFHGANEAELGKAEFVRRAHVAIQIDELLQVSMLLSVYQDRAETADQEEGYMLDFEYTNDDIASLRKQMALRRTVPTPLVNPSSSPETRSQQSNGLSPASSILSDPSPSSPRAPRKRRLSSSSSLSDADENDDDDDEQPLADRVTGSSGSRPRRGGKSSKGGKNNPALKKAHIAPASLAPPVGEEQALMNGKVNGINGHETKIKVEDKLDEGQLNRLAAGVPVDATKGTGVLTKTEKAAVIEMRKGITQVIPVGNDGHPQSWVILTGLKTLFQKQLPQMPREYIARLVYDSNSRGLAIVKRGYKVVGGICFRPFPHRGFAEIVFFATNSADQEKGYGGMLMDHFKAHVRKTYPDMMHFLTYADNYAVKYFEKQGFSKDITLDRSMWAGYIKDYEGATIMQCTMLTKVDYLNKPALLVRQKEAILTKIKSMSKSHIVYAGLPQFQPGQPEGVVLDPKDIPGLRETGWSHSMMANAIRRTPKSADRAFMETTLNDLIRHPRSWPFRAPVDKIEVPDYYEVIKSPMDLKTVEEKMKAGKYMTIDSFAEDVQLIIENCKSYNPESTVYYRNADKLEELFNEFMAKRPS